MDSAVIRTALPNARKDARHIAPALVLVFAIHAGEGGAGGFGAGTVQVPAMLTGLRFAYIGGAAAEFLGAALAVGFIRRHSHHASP